MTFGINNFVSPAECDQARRDGRVAATMSKPADYCPYVGPLKQVWLNAYDEQKAYNQQIRDELIGEF